MQGALLLIRGDFVPAGPPYELIRTIRRQDSRQIVLHSLVTRSRSFAEKVGQRQFVPRTPAPRNPGTSEPTPVIASIRIRPRIRPAGRSAGGRRCGASPTSACTADSLGQIVEVVRQQHGRQRRAPPSARTGCRRRPSRTAAACSRSRARGRRAASRAAGDRSIRPLPDAARTKTHDDDGVVARARTRARDRSPTASIDPRARSP